jgi:hypothetical protein
VPRKVENGIGIGTQIERDWIGDITVYGFGWKVRLRGSTFAPSSMLTLRRFGSKAHATRSKGKMTIDIQGFHSRTRRCGCGFGQ